MTAGECWREDSRWPARSVGRVVCGQELVWGQRKEQDAHTGVWGLADAAHTLGATQRIERMIIHC